MFFYDREVLKGIKAKIDESQLKLTIHIESIENADDILTQHWDYVIADYDKPDRHRIIPRLKSHVLIYSSYKIEHAPESVSTLVNDNEQFACLALGQFIQNEIPNVGFYMDASESNTGWANERKSFFEKHAELLGLNLHRDIKKAIDSRPFPLGVYCATDRSAMKLVNFCLAKNISVPSQISIIGTDYDDAERLLSPMPLSSINIDPYLLGQRCVEVLLKAVRFKRVLHEKYQPINLMNGKSTTVDENQDDIVNKALYYLHNNFHLNINVHQVIDFCRVSRKTLDNRFIASKGMTVHQYLSNLRLKKSKKLLRNSNDSIECIALQCGYPNQSYLYQVYRKQFDYTPCEYRNSSHLV
jgi:AraC-like DNA-binding protein